MFIVPFFIEPPKETKIGFKFWTAWVFMTQKGQAVWTVNEPITKDPQLIIKEYLEGNNIYGTYIPTQRKDVILYKVNTTKTSIPDFYTWNDMLTTSCGDDVWRPFFWVGDTMYGESDDWGWEEQLKELKIGTFGSMDTLWKVLREGAIL
jgi:hypothetical protein